MTKIVALVPMRHHSERVPRKNYRECAGQPLFHHILRTLAACPLIDGTVVDTDSPIITAGLADDFPEVQTIQRPEHLRAGTIAMNDILFHDTSIVKADYYLQTHSTNPLLQVKTITTAIQFFLDNFPAYDSLFSVTRLQTRLWDDKGEPVNHDLTQLLRTQDLSPLFEENSCLYLFTRDTLLTRRNRIGERPYMFEIDALEAWDIDDELDFQIAEHLLEQKTKSRPEQPDLKTQ